jgi:hypothetical protein
MSKERERIEQAIHNDNLFAAEQICDALLILRNIVKLADLGTIPRGTTVGSVVRAIKELEKIR